MRPELPMEELTEAMTAAERWFGFIENALTETGTPVARLTYEEHVLGGPEVLLAALAEALPGFAWTPGDPVPPSRLPRQDRTEDVFDRIANGAALRAELDAAGLAGAALGYPGSSSRS